MKESWDRPTSPFGIPELRDLKRKLDAVSQIDQAGAPLDGRSTLSEIRARILAAPTSSAGDPPWLADAKVLLAALDARGEPVAWGIRYPNGFISPYTHKADAETNCPRTCRVLPLYTSPPTTDREKRLVEAARVAKEELELFVEFAVRQCEFEGDGQAGRDAVNSLTRALEAYRND